MLREIKGMEYELRFVTATLKEKGFVLISEQPIQSGIIKEYQFWHNGKSDTTIGLEVWKNDTAIILKQISLNQI